MAYNITNLVFEASTDIDSLKAIDRDYTEMSDEVVSITIDDLRVNSSKLAVLAIKEAVKVSAMGVEIVAPFKPSVLVSWASDLVAGDLMVYGNNERVIILLAPVYA